MRTSREWCGFCRGGVTHFRATSLNTNYSRCPELFISAPNATSLVTSSKVWKAFAYNKRHHLCIFHRKFGFSFIVADMLDIIRDMLCFCLVLPFAEFNKSGISIICAGVPFNPIDTRMCITTRTHTHTTSFGNCVCVVVVATSIELQRMMDEKRPFII